MIKAVYTDAVTPIQLGDEVELRGGLLLGFKKLKGRVIYVPGLSPPHPDMERDGLAWVAIDIRNRALIRRLVDPESGVLAKRVTLLRRLPWQGEDVKALLDSESDN